MEGQIVSHYKILERLGGGGMGVVYRARDTRLARHAAVKVLRPDASPDPERKARLKQEARSASALNHPNIITIYDIDSANGVDFIAMEYVDGQSLASLIAAGPLPPDDALKYAVQMASALAAAHEAGIVHRDIKPANIMVTTSGHVKVLDFGVAKLTEMAADSGASTLTALAPATDGVVLGTPAYMSPEQAQGRLVDARSDVFSFGAVLYEMLASRRPFTGDSRESVVAAICGQQPAPLREVRGDVPADLELIAWRCLKKAPAARYQSGTELVAELTACQTRLVVRTMPVTTLLKRPAVAATAVLLVIASLATGVWRWTRAARVRWALDDAIPQIERLVEQDRYVAAYDLAQKADAYLADDRILRELWPRFATTATLVTSPEGADIYFREYRSTDGDWRYLGGSPLRNIRLPRGTFRWKIQKTGFATLEVATPSLFGTVDFPPLTESTPLPRDMVRVPAGGAQYLGLTGLNSPQHNAPLRDGMIGSFLIDRYEVTNRQFKEFVESGGYGEPRYWTQPFIKAGRSLSWSEAMAEFRDSTGRPGPATWELGDYPRGQDEYPVGGVSWYEAAAYAEFRGMELPTLFHWSRAALSALSGDWVSTLWSPLVEASNFSGKGPAPVGKSAGIGPFGTYDMAGNVREWCWNEVSEHRYILGGSWSDPSYMFNSRYRLPPFDRSPQNGFRMVQYLEGDPDGSLTGPIEVPQKDFLAVKPVSDEVFEVFRRQYSSIKSPLNSRVESVDDAAAGWTREKITINAGYGGERVTTYLFLPKRSSRRHHVVVLWGGVGPFFIPGATVPSSGARGSDLDLVDLVVKSGRAVAWPVWKGSFERYDGYARLTGEEYLRTFRERMNHWRQDLGRTIDYLQSRPDIDSEKVAYLAHSLVGPPLPLLTLEERIKVAVLMSGGLPTRDAPPEGDPVNYLPRTRIPVLLIGGNYDTLFPVETLQKPLMTLLGTDPQHKRHAILEGGHGFGNLPRAQAIREMLAWLDQYLGPTR